ncbi:hypothetical protein BDR22DRAFT_710958 [Usnea florida]
MAFWLMTKNEPRPSPTKERGTPYFTIFPSGIKDTERQVNEWLNKNRTRSQTLSSRSDNPRPPLRRQQFYNSTDRSHYHLTPVIALRRIRPSTQAIEATSRPASHISQLQDIRHSEEHVPSHPTNSAHYHAIPSENPSTDSSNKFLTLFP